MNQGFIVFIELEFSGSVFKVNVWFYDVNLSDHLHKVQKVLL